MDNDIKTVKISKESYAWQQLEANPIGTAAELAELKAALTQSRAETAAAYERAADQFEKIRAPLTYGEIFSMIRALATPYQTAALDAVKAEAREEGMRQAAKICETLGPLGGVTPNPRAEWKTHADNLAHAILAAIKGSKS